MQNKFIPHSLAEFEHFSGRYNDRLIQMQVDRLGDVQREVNKVGDHDDRRFERDNARIRYG